MGRHELIESLYSSPLLLNSLVLACVLWVWLSSVVGVVIKCCGCGY